MYKTLPDFLTINKSYIHGLGIFATQDISPNIDLGISHIRNSVGHFENNYIRTPLGGLINHSDEPNCIKYQPFVVGSHLLPAAIYTDQVAKVNMSLHFIL